MEAWKWAVGIGALVGGVLLWRRRKHSAQAPVFAKPTPPSPPIGTVTLPDATKPYVDAKGRTWQVVPVPTCSAAVSAEQAAKLRCPSFGFQTQTVQGSIYKDFTSEEAANWKKTLDEA